MQSKIFTEKQKLQISPTRNQRKSCKINKDDLNTLRNHINKEIIKCSSFNK